MCGLTIVCALCQVEFMCSDINSKWVRRAAPPQRQLYREGRAQGSVWEHAVERAVCSGGPYAAPSPGVPMARLSLAPAELRRHLLTHSPAHLFDAFLQVGRDAQEAMARLRSTKSQAGVQVIDVAKVGLAGAWLSPWVCSCVRVCGQGRRGRRPATWSRQGWWALSRVRVGQQLKAHGWLLNRCMASCTSAASGEPAWN